MAIHSTPWFATNAKPKTAPTIECVPETGIFKTEASICQEAAPNMAHAWPIM